MIQPDWLEHQAAARPRHAALVTDQGSLDFSALRSRVAGRAGRLRELRPHARVGIVLENGSALVESVLACLRMGRVAVLFDPRLPVDEATPLAESTAPELFLASRATRDNGRALADAVGADLHVVGEEGVAREPVAPGVDLDRPAVVVFSSGTSGRPKPIELTAGNLFWSAVGSAARLGARPDDRWLACLPLSHLGGLSILFRSILFGTTMIVQRGFELEAVQGALAEQSVTMMSLVPTTLARLVQSAAGGPIDAPKLRAVLVGGASASLDLLREARAVGLPVAPTYGLTETASQVATLPPEASLEETGGVGVPLLSTEVRIVDAQGREVAPGEVGRIDVRGATVAPRAVAEDGWLHTGDLGRTDEAHGLTVLGRHDDVVVTGGENVSPAEVEAVLARHPGIAEVAVAALPDPLWGQIVGAWVVPTHAPPTLEALRDACRAHLAPHELPRRLTLVDELPRTALGKIQRRRLVEPPSE